MEAYQSACESVEVLELEEVHEGRRFFMGGDRKVRADYFLSAERPVMTIGNSKLRFNTACLKKFEDVEYVEQHYSEDGDVLRPTKELEEMNIFTAEPYHFRCKCCLLRTCPEISS